ncbi:hypothetical protein ACI68E_000088 [Malassezia pachydermatis]
MDREEFFRLKKVQGKKKRTAEEAAKKHKEELSKLEAADNNKAEKKEGDMLSAGKDTDVIF